MWHRRLFSGTAASVLVVIIVTSIASPAAAHESLVSSSPTEGQQYASAPQEIELVFTDEVLPVGAAIVVIDESGKNWVEGEVVLNGATVTATLASGMPEAGYQVRWRVVSGDGHPISSKIPFTIGDARPFVDTAPTPVATNSSSESEGSRSPAADGPGLPAWGLIGLGLGGAIIAAGIYFAVSSLVRRGNK